MTAKPRAAKRVGTLEQSRPSKAAIRLLRSLSLPGSYACQSDLPMGPPGSLELVIIQARKMVSVRTGTASLDAASTLVSRDLACWEQNKNKKTRLTISPAGQAYLARLDAGEATSPWFAQHADIAMQDSPDAVAKQGTVAINMKESPLLWLARRRGQDGSPLIDASCLEAGERIRRDLTFAQMLPKLGTNWSHAGAGSGSYNGQEFFSDSVLAARQRIDRALEHIGPEFSGLVIDVCGFLKGLSQIERERAWPAGSAKIVLVMALRRLGEHYGLNPVASGKPIARSNHYWGAPGARPLSVRRRIDEPGASGAYGQQSLEETSEMQ